LREILIAFEGEMMSRVIALFAVLTFMTIFAAILPGVHPPGARASTASVAEIGRAHV
jgi:hypothetical protein